VILVTAVGIKCPDRVCSNRSGYQSRLNSNLAKISSGKETTAVLETAPNGRENDGAAHTPGVGYK
jgi:hypothetical protein